MVLAGILTRIMSGLRIGRIVSAAILLTTAVWVGAQAPAAGWPQWRGPNRDGSAPLTPPARWPESLTQKWKVEVGLGYASPIVVGPRVYMFSRRGENETLAAYDAASGKEVWQASYPAPYELVKAAAAHGMGPKGTPVFADGRIFTFGISGILSAFDAASGKRLWQKQAPEVGPTFSTSQSPLVDRGLLIVHVGGNNKGALTAFDVATGEPKWQWTGDGPGYGSPIVAEIAGTRQIVTFTQDNLLGVDAATGQQLWLRPFRMPSNVNPGTPIIYRDTIIVSGQDVGIAALRVTKKGTAWTVEDVWQNDTLFFRLSNGVIVGDALFSLAQTGRGQFFFADARSGKTLWTGEPRTAENAAIAKAGNLLLVLKADGELLVADGSDPSRFEPTRRYKVSDAATWAQPAIVGNRFFVKDLTSLTLWTAE
jgi:outer membrane protein assembly factor BamB